ncbi:hypothetical protein VTK26DRAFT_9048 [Humicola hyalothermophila]
MQLIYLYMNESHLRREGPYHAHWSNHDKIMAGSGLSRPTQLPVVVIQTRAKNDITLAAPAIPGISQYPSKGRPAGGHGLHLHSNLPIGGLKYHPPKSQLGKAFPLHKSIRGDSRLKEIRLVPPHPCPTFSIIIVGNLPCHLHTPRAYIKATYPTRQSTGHSLQARCFYQPLPFLPEVPMSARVDCTS